MLDVTLRWTAVLLSGIVLLGFALFAIDEARGASSASQADIADVTLTAAVPTPRQEAVRERMHGRTREAVDDASDVVLAPFAWVAPADSGAWVGRGVPTLLALLVYGFGLGYVARITQARA